MGYPLSSESKRFLDAMNELSVQISSLVAVIGSVTVTNFPSVQPVSGLFYPATQPVTGTFWQAVQPISGSVSTSPITSGTAGLTASSVITTSAVKIIGSNPNRRGLSLYNNSANSVYLKLGAAGNGGTDMSFILATFAHLSINQLFPGLVWTGEVWGIRNAGTGQIIATEIL